MKIRGNFVEKFAENLHDFYRIFENVYELMWETIKNSLIKMKSLGNNLGK